VAIGGCYAGGRLSSATSRWAGSAAHAYLALLRRLLEQELVVICPQRVRMLIPEPTLRARIASATAGLRRIFANPIDLSGPVLPHLENYPYRG
jgi:hypothetical protein